MHTEERPLTRVRPLHALFEDQTRRTPEAIALEVPPTGVGVERVRLSYAELDAAAANLAARLVPFVMGECVIAVFLPRATAELFVAQLAIHKAGAAWTCIEPNTPPERLRFLLADSRAVAVIAEDSAQATLTAAGLPADRRIAPRGPAPTLPHRPREADLSSLAYVIYTSGTTGQPKGVMIEHGMAANLVLADRDYFDLGPGDRIAQTSSAAYDSSVEEVWLAWGSGATLVIVHDDLVRSGPDLLPWLREERTTISCAPARTSCRGCVRSASRCGAPHRRCSA